MEDDELILMTQNGMVIRLQISTLRDLSRATQGVRLIKLEEGDKLTGVARVCEEEEEGEEQEEPTQETVIKDEEEVKTKTEETKGEE
jgi:DNA gyrase subunit A